MKLVGITRTKSIAGVLYLLVGWQQRDSFFESWVPKERVLDMIKAAYAQKNTSLSFPIVKGVRKMKVLKQTPNSDSSEPHLFKSILSAPNPIELREESLVSFEPDHRL